MIHPSGEKAEIEQTLARMQSGNRKAVLTLQVELLEQRIRNTDLEAKNMVQNLIPVHVYVHGRVVLLGGTVFERRHR